MRILVAGGAGFLGSHLSEKLLNLGHEVLVVDNFYTGNKANISKLLDHNSFELIRHDVTFPLFVEVDAICNLASPASPKHYQKYPVQTLKTNLMGSINLLGLARRTGAPILQASTSEVYGDPSVSPQSEEYWGNVNPIGIRSCYDEGKRAAESLFFDYYRQYGVNIKVARIFNTYGPRMDLDDGRVVSNFIVQALKNEPVTLYGNGTQTRSFCFVSDLIEGLTSLLFSGAEVVGPINLGNPHEYSMLELAQLIIKKANSNSEVVYRELPMDDPQQRKPDIEKARKYLNWSPSVSLQDGIDFSIPDFQRRLNDL